MARDPYCGNCGYSLKGLVDSARCPECGRPLVEVLERERTQLVGRRYRSSTVIFGLPLVHIAMGPHENERIGRARGIIAIGDVATGWFAFGGMAFGLVALGGVSLGVVTLGGLSIGLLAALGGGAVGGLAIGGGALGGIATGGMAAGYVAQGGMAVGYFARGGATYAAHALSPTMRDPAALAFFNDYAWMFGGGMRPGLSIIGVTLGVAILFAALLGVLIWAALWRRGRRPVER